VAGRLSDGFGRRNIGAMCYMLAPVMTLWMYNTTGRAVIPAWVLQLFFDIAAGTIFSAYAAELFPTSHRSTAGSALQVAGTTGGSLGLLLEALLYRYTHSHWTAVSYMTMIWMIAPLIMFFGFPETAGRELEAISPEHTELAEPV
jgi:MFS family permease